MARAIIDVTWCDWHSQLPEKPRVEARNTRAYEDGSEVDLCHFCALLFDVVHPRRDEILPFLQPDVLTALRRSARDPSPLQRKKVTEPLPPARGHAEGNVKSAAAKTRAKKRKVSPAGVWREDVVQVRCPLPHRSSRPKEYWVDLRNRTAHAHGHKREDGTGHYGPDIDFELQPGVTFTHFCTEHQVCAEHGGYGFLSAASLDSHIKRAVGWKPASKAARDAAATKMAAKNS
ncbi:hypothetical protein ACF06W_11185 [Streptomyces albus]|uniref:hypothetical protein n=1 Tax=Streptomyces albus TaxID=1888 RepID=UPI0036F9F4C9